MPSDPPPPKAKPPRTPILPKRPTKGLIRNAGGASVPRLLAALETGSRLETQEALKIAVLLLKQVRGKRQGNHGRMLVSDIDTDTLSLIHTSVVLARVRLKIPAGQGRVKNAPLLPAEPRRRVKKAAQDCE